MRGHVSVIRSLTPASNSGEYTDAYSLISHVPSGKEKIEDRNIRY